MVIVVVTRRGRDDTASSTVDRRRMLRFVRRTPLYSPNLFSINAIKCVAPVNRLSSQVGGVRFYRGVPRFRDNPKAALYGVMGLNVLVFGAWKVAESDSLPEKMIRRRNGIRTRRPSPFYRFMLRHFMVSPESIVNGRIHTLVTSCVSQKGIHANLSH